MLRQSIKIELDISPENALLLAFVIQKGLQENEVKSILSNIGKQIIIDAAQSIVNQIQEKTNFEKLKTQNDLLGGTELN